MAQEIITVFIANFVRRTLCSETTQHQEIQVQV